MNELPKPLAVGLVVFAIVVGLTTSIVASVLDWDRTRYEGELQFTSLHKLEEFVSLMDDLGHDVEDISVKSPLTVTYRFTENNPIDWPYEEGDVGYARWEVYVFGPLVAATASVLAWMVGTMAIVIVAVLTGMGRRSVGAE